jgi:halimadienyl-diphosphate synthase
MVLPHPPHARPVSSPPAREFHPRIRKRQQAYHLCAAVAADLDPFWGGGAISTSAYETAWVALLRDPHHADRLAFPAALEWLLRQQHADGHWGTTFPYTVLPTLAGLLAMTRTPHPSTRSHTAQARARAYLLQRLPAWDPTTFDTPLFEFLVPALLTALADPALIQIAPGLALMHQRTQAKLQHVPLDLLYGGQSPLIHALEALGPLLEPNRVMLCQATNGSFGNSPAATAAVLASTPTWNTDAAAWLTYLGGRESGGEHGGMPASHPADIFEVAWVCNWFWHGGIPLTNGDLAVARMLDWLAGSLTPDGLAYGRTRGLPADVDDTAVGLTVLRRAGQDAPLDPLWRFQADDHFVSYPGERVASSSANAHVLEALCTGTQELASLRTRLARYLLDQRTGAGWWEDKWHLSPYYASATCILALVQTPELVQPEELRPTLTWLLAGCQGKGWGMATPTAEETAYAVLSLVALRDIVPVADRNAWRHVIGVGLRCLARHGALLPPAQQPSMWVDKTLYHPRRVSAAAILAALHTPFHLKRDVS